MDKKEVVIAMTKKGYHVTIEDRIPMFLLETSLQTPAQLKKALKEIGYHNSFGYKLVSKDSLPKGIGKGDDLELKGNDHEIKENDLVFDWDESKNKENDLELQIDTAVLNEKQIDPESEEESSLWSDSDDFFESTDGQMSFF